MIYALFDYFQNLPLSRLVHYVTFRAIFSFIISLLFVTMVGGKIIALLRRKQIGETVRDLGLAGEKSKKNTPTMGGLIIIAGLLLPILLFSDLSNIYVLMMLITTLAMGTLGFVDDYIKVIRRKKDGLRPRSKIVTQVGLGVMVCAVLYLSPKIVIRENILTPAQVQSGPIVNNSGAQDTAARAAQDRALSLSTDAQPQESEDQALANNIIPSQQENGAHEVVQFQEKEVKSNKTTIPFVKSHNFSFADWFPKDSPSREMWGWFLYFLFTVIIITFISNCTNLTDGLDGLTVGVAAPAGVILGIFAYVSSHREMAAYLNTMLVPGTEELVIFAAAFVGALLGFLWHNGYPATVFMGDTGSLTIGGIIAVFAILIRKEALLPILCGVFVMEGLSVFFQSLYFKIIKVINRRRPEEKKIVRARIWRIAPLHHHYQRHEKKDGSGEQDLQTEQALNDRALINIPPGKLLHESKITVRFWLISIILAAITLISLKIR